VIFRKLPLKDHTNLSDRDAEAQIVDFFVAAKSRKEKEIIPGGMKLLLLTMIASESLKHILIDWNLNGVTDLNYIDQYFRLFLCLKIDSSILQIPAGSWDNICETLYSIKDVERQMLLLKGLDDLAVELVRDASLNFKPKRKTDVNLPLLVICLLEHDLSSASFKERHFALHENALFIKSSRDKIRGGICDLCLGSRGEKYVKEVEYGSGERETKGINGDTARCRSSRRRSMAK
jgi:hypothetical protein